MSDTEVSSAQSSEKLHIKSHSSEIYDGERRFQIETINYKGREIVVISMEHEKRYRNDPELVPPDWISQVQDKITNSSLLFVEYFVPDIMSQLPGVPPVDRYIKQYTEERIEPVYGKIEALAREIDIPIATAEVGASYPYAFYELLTQAPRRISIMARNLPSVTKEEKILPLLNSGSFGVKATKTENYFPYSINMRRILTSLAIMQEAERRKEGSKIALFTAPAHANRIKEHLKSGLNSWQKITAGIGRHLPGLNSNLRIYKPLSDGNWIRTASMPIT